MISGELLGFILRGLAAVVWTALFVIRIRQRPARRASDLRIKLADLTVVVVAWALVLGALVNLDLFSVDILTNVYTVVATGVFLVGLTLLTMKDEM